MFREIALFLLGMLFVHFHVQAAKIDKNVCVIVDGFSTGRTLVDGIKAYGFSCIHIQSAKGLEAVYGNLDENRYLEELSYTGSLQEILEKLAPYSVKFVIPGSESGILLADQLAYALNVFPNDIHKSFARRNKYAMTEAVQKEGLKVVEFYKSEDVHEIVQWVEAVDSWPIVIKPLESAGGDNVHFCNSITEVQAARDKVKTSLNVFGMPNKEILVQTFAHGQEYMVNAVASDDLVMITDMWRVNKKSAAYDYFVNVDHRDSEYLELASYAKAVCKALGVHYGAMHLEVKYDPAGGPTFIECGARLMGSAELSFQTAIHGYNQLTILLESYFNPAFFKLIALYPPQTDVKYGMTVALISDREGKIKDCKSIEYFKESPCFHSLIFKPKEGDLLRKTIDMVSSPGDVLLLSSDKEELIRECQRVREIEKRLYQNMLLG